VVNNARVIRFDHLLCCEALSIPLPQHKMLLVPLLLVVGVGQGGL
jgi:hypothetical protein